LREGRLRGAALAPDERMRRPGLGTLVLDEADLMLAMPGYAADLAALAPLVRTPPVLLRTSPRTRPWCRLHPFTVTWLRAFAAGARLGQGPARRRMPMSGVRRLPALTWGRQRRGGRGRLGRARARRCRAAASAC